MPPFHEHAQKTRLIVLSAHHQHPPVEAGADVVVRIGGRECGQRLERLPPRERSALGVGPDEAPIEQGADCLLIALAETGDESGMRFARRLLIVNRSGPADHQRARGQDRNRDGSDHEATHDMPPAARV